MRSFDAHRSHDLSVVQHIEEHEERDVNEELSEPGLRERTEERPDETEVEIEDFREDHVDAVDHADKEVCKDERLEKQYDVDLMLLSGRRKAGRVPVVFFTFLLCAAFPDEGGDDHDKDEQDIPADEAVAHRHAEDVFGQRQKRVTELRHEREGKAGDKDRDHGAAPPCAALLQRFFGRKVLLYEPEHRHAEQKIHQREHGEEHAEHGQKDEVFFQHRGLVRRSQVFRKVDRLVKPRHRRGKTFPVMGGQAVIGIEKLHPAGGAVFELPEGRVPGCVIGCRAEEFIAQRRLQELVRHVPLIITEITEFVVFRLQKKDVVEMDVRGVVHAAAEKLAALQDDGLRGDAFAGGIGLIRIIGRDRPAGPGSHRMAADRKTGIVDLRKRREESVGVGAAAGAVGDRIPGVVLRVFIVEEAQVAEIHEHAVALRTADRLDRAVGFRFVAVVDFYDAVYITSADQTCVRRAVAVFVDRKNDGAPPRQFDRVGGICLMVVLVAVQKEDTRGLRGRRRTLRRIKLIGYIACFRRNGTVRDRDRTVIPLDPVGEIHGAGGDRKKQNESDNAAQFR